MAEIPIPTLATEGCLNCSYPKNAHARAGTALICPQAFYRPVDATEHVTDGPRLDDEAFASEAAARRDSQSPIPMLLYCPECGERHIDYGEFATKPHHTHACQNCGLTWRPAIVATVGVRYLPGFKDDTRG